MNHDDADTNGKNAPIDLAHIAAFPLGTLTVDPAARTVAVGAWSHRLEPRVMQVLVLLAQAAPKVVGRSDLNARAWGSRVVGDDAINRAVQTLRRIATEAPGPVPFAITTIPRVGYKLDCFISGVGDSLDPPTARPDRPVADNERSRWPIIAAAVLLILSVAAAILWSRMHSHPVGSTSWRVVSSRMLDDLPPGAMDLALSPDGRRLAYRVHLPGGGDGIFVRAMINGGIGYRVSPPTVDAHHPVWNHDSNRLAFLAFETGRPCRIYVSRLSMTAVEVAGCETARDPHLAWSVDGRSLLFGDAPGENGVRRITAILAGGRRTVLSSPPGDSMGDDLPISRGRDVIFQRTFGWADEGWIARDSSTGRERPLWRRSGVAGTAAAALPDGTVAIAWTRAGASGLDMIDAAGRLTTQPLPTGAISAMSAAGSQILIEADRSESELLRANDHGPPSALAWVRGKIAGPALLRNGTLRFPVTSAGVARIWELEANGSLRQWGNFSAVRIAGLVPNSDGSRMAALVTGDVGREITVFDATSKPVFRWNPHARSVNPAAWCADEKCLIVPILDGAGWRLFEIDPFHSRPPRDLNQPGFAIVQNDGAALYAVRAGENTGIRELWRLDGNVRRLPIDLTLFDIVNWHPSGDGIWLPDRSDREQPMLMLRNVNTGRVIRRLPAPKLAGSSMGLTADAGGPIYVSLAREAPEYSVLQLTAIRR